MRVQQKRSLQPFSFQTENQYNINMENIINPIKGARAKIKSEVNSPDFDLREGDVVEFVSWDEKPVKNDLADMLGCPAGTVKGALLNLFSEEGDAVGWFAIDVRTNTILSY